MSFLFGGGSRPSPPPVAPAPAPATVTQPRVVPAAPVQTGRATTPEGDTDTVLAQLRKRRRGLSTILTGNQTVLGATAGKTLLGA